MQQKEALNVYWDRKANKGSKFSQPWLDLNKTFICTAVDNDLNNLPKPLNEIYPPTILKDLKDKKILCLAGGGGQQSVVFSLLGANVTIFDISKEQLKMDEIAARHYGYEISTVQGDMADLSAFADNWFDLVYQAPSMGYAPDIQAIYKEVERVLKPGCLYRADAQNPLAQFINPKTWDGTGYKIDTPYRIKSKTRENIEKIKDYRHTLNEAFNGLIETGFDIISVHEMPTGLYATDETKPGSWTHSLEYIPGLFAILARKIL